MNKAKLNKKFDVSDAEIESWAKEYESDDWSGMKFGKAISGRPRIYEEPMERISVTLPHESIVAMKEYCSAQNISRSELVRRAVSRELANMQQ